MNFLSQSEIRAQSKEAVRKGEGRNTMSIKKKDPQEKKQTHAVKKDALQAKSVANMYNMPENPGVILPVNPVKEI